MPQPCFKPFTDKQHPLVWLMFTFALATVTSTATAQDTGKQQYTIARQSLQSAISQLANQADLEINYPSHLVKGLNSPGLNGRYTAQDALNQLLAQTALKARVAADNAFTIEKAPTSYLKVNSANDGKSQPRTELEGTDTTLPKVTVEADAAYDPEYYADPYNKDYVIPNATAGTKTDTPIMETPLNVQVISKQVLKDQQVISLDKALRNISGVTTQTGSGGDNHLFLRGFDTQTLFRNGFRMDQTSITSFVGSNQQFANVESVEVLKGPAAILYGRVEPGGMVNIVTKQPKATPYYSLNQQFGSYDLYRTSIDATGPLTKDDTLLYRVNTSFQSNNSFRDLVKGEDVFFAPILKWNISPRTQATLEMEYNRSISSLDNQILPLVDNHFIDIPHNRNLGERNPAETENIFVGFNWSHQFNNDWSIKHQVAFKRQDQNLGINVVPQDITNGEVGRLVTNGHFRNDTVSTSLDLTGHFKTWGLEHTLLLGGDFYQFEATGSQAFSKDFLASSVINLDHPDHPGSNLFIDPSTLFQFDQNTENYGLYLQDQIKLPYHVHVMGGLRYQYVHSTLANAGADGVFSQTGLPQTDDAVTPRVGILWQPEKWLSLYSNYAENFGQNTGAFGFGGTVNSSKLLPAQSAQQWEVGVKTELFDGRFRATLAYYDLTKQNVATNDVTHPAPFCGGSGCSIAAGEVRSQGPELDIQGEILPGWNVIATYANQDVRVTKSKGDPNGQGFEVGNRLQFVPRNIGSVWTTYEVQQGDLKGFKIGGGVRMQDSGVDSTNTVKSTGYALVGLMTGYSFEIGKSKITAQLNIDNLLDKSYFNNPVPITKNFGFVNFSTPRTFMGSINVEY